MKGLNHFLQDTVILATQRRQFLKEISRRQKMCFPVVTKIVITISLLLEGVTSSTFRKNGSF